MKPAEVKGAVQLYDEGLSSGQVGHKLGFDNHTILNALRSSGVAIRKPAAARRATK